MRKENVQAVTVSIVGTRAGCQGSRAKRPDRSESALPHRLAFVRSNGRTGDRSLDPLPDRSSLADVTSLGRFVRAADDLVLRVLRPEVVEDFVRDRFRQNPGRTLRLDRTWVRSAQMRANDLSAEAELIGDRFRPESHFVRHASPFARGAIDSLRPTQSTRSYARTQAIDRIFTLSLHFVRSVFVRTFVRVDRCCPWWRRALSPLTTPPYRPPPKGPSTRALRNFQSAAGWLCRFR